MNKTVIAFIFSFFVIQTALWGQKNLSRASVKEITQPLFTYTYDSPREFFSPGRLYPYHRFDYFSAKGDMKKWKMIEMENEYIKLWICPAIGGKVWGAIDKKTGKEFFYYNHVVKFRDVASRGPWTSGGLEMNFGVIGHAPWASSQVDYKIQENDNGDAVCTIGGLDISLGTKWRVQLILPADKAYLETKVIWYNATDWRKPYYQWMNLGIKVGGDLNYQYPGNRYLTHDGNVRPWPKEKGHTISRYDENDFGHYKSYHVFGKMTNFWGAYWKKDNFGMCHVTPYQDKLGKKIWIWGLSRYGMVWKKLLTDKDDQYTEVQSGKLFNQSIGTSYTTPFKHSSFLPGVTYTWSEYWFPVQKIGKIDGASKKIAYSIINQGENAKVNCYAVSPIHDTLHIISGSNHYERELNLSPTDTIVWSIPKQLQQKNYKVLLGNEILFDGSLNNASLKRPTQSPSDFDYSSSYGLYLQGKEFERQNFLLKAEDKYKASLAKEPYFIPTLVGLAGIYYGQNKTDEALDLVRTALSIDTYHGESNYLYGLLSAKKQNLPDAIDGFSVALQNPTYESIAAQQLAMLYVRNKDYKKAETLINRSLSSNANNIVSLQLKIVIERLLGKKKEALASIQTLQKKDPLHSFSYFEKFLITRDNSLLNELRESLVSEYWDKTYLEIALLYEQVGQYETAFSFLNGVQRNSTAILYKKAYLAHLSGKQRIALETLEKAESASSYLLFPRRTTDERMYLWAIKQGGNNWKSNYYLGMLYLSMNRKKEAQKLFEKCGTIPDYYAFYLTRAIYMKGGESDFKKAIQLSPKQFVSYQELAKYYLKQASTAKAVDILERYRKINKENSYINLLLAKAYLRHKQYKKGLRLMKSIQILPNEGSLEGRNVWRETNLNYAILCIQKGKYSNALKCIQDARVWPESLGVGKPYQANCDERLEDYLESYIKQLKGENSAEIKARLAGYSLKRQPEAVSNLFTLIALKDSIGRNVIDKKCVEWGQNYSKYKAVRWAMAVCQNKKKEAYTIALEDEQLKEALPFEVLFRDRDFVVILENYKFFSNILFQ